MFPVSTHKPLTKIITKITLIGGAVFLFLLFGGARTHAAVSLVQIATSTHSGTYVSVTLGSNVTANDILAVAVVGNSASSTLANVTSSCVTGNLVITAATSTSSGNFGAGMAYGVISSSGSCMVTANFAGSATNAIGVHEISGAFFSAPLDVAASMLATPVGGQLTSGTSTTLFNGDYIFGVAMPRNGSATSSPGLGFSSRVSLVSGPNIFTEDEIQPSAGNISATFTTAANINWFTGMMAFAPLINPLVTSFSAFPTTTYAGATSMLSWNVINASSVTITPGSFSTTTLVGSIAVNPTSTTLYNLTAANGNGTFIATTTVTVFPIVVPTVTATPSVVVTSTATLGVTITNTGGATSTAVGVNYGTSSAYGSAASSSGGFGLNASSSFNLSNLHCNTTYHYQGFAINSAGMGTSTDQIFTTGMCITDWPVAAAPSMASAAITWRTLATNAPFFSNSIPNYALSNSQVNYGLTTAYGLNVSSSSLSLSHGLILAGLLPDTTYHYQVVSTDANGNSATSPDYTFTTLSAPSGLIKTVKAGGGGDYVTISACANAAVSSSVSGWTCEVFPGTYNEIVSLSNFFGSSGNQITFIANGDVVVAGFSLTNSNYVNIKGFEITTTFPGSSYKTCSTEYDGITLNNSNYINITSNYFHFIYNGMFVRWQPFGTVSNHVNILNNIMAFTDMQSYTGNSAVDATCGTPSSGGWAAVEGWGNYNLFDGNDLQGADHFFEVSGSYNIFRRNVAHDTYAADFNGSSTVSHLDFFHPFATSQNPTIHNLIEGNWDYNRNDESEHFYLASTDSLIKPLGVGNGSLATFSGTLDGAPLIPGEIMVENASSSIYGNDDGNGGFVGSGISSGTVNYLTGSISVTFIVAPSSSNPIVANYATASSSHDIIVRHNLASNVGSFFYQTTGGANGGQPGTHLYNNTIFHQGYNASTTQQQSSAITFALYSPHWTALNNIYDDAVKDGYAPWGYSGLSPYGQQPGYSLLYNSNCGGLCNWFGANGIPSSTSGMVLNQNPLFNNTSTYDFTLQAASPARNVGTYLTTVSSADSGSGTTLVVSDAGFFQDGYGISGVNPDCISVASVSNHVCISSVNYQTNTITLSSPILRSPGDPVWLYSNSLGQMQIDTMGPDLGAFTYNQITTYTIGGIVSGLMGTVVLQNNGGDNINISSNGSFVFVTPIASGGTYTVSVLTQPTGQTCTASNTSGMVATSNVTDVSVSCVTNASTTPSGSGVSVGVASGYAMPPVQNLQSVIVSSIATLAPISSPSAPVPISSLQAKLASLLQQLVALQIQVGTLASSSASFTRNLSFGMVGDDIAQLQQFLITQNVGPAARALEVHSITRNFGILTHRALVEFQKKNGITPALGYFGALTRAWIKNH